MANTRDIRNRIRGVKNTRQITKAMQMVATSKMKRAQESAKAGRPYALLLADIIGSLSDNYYSYMGALRDVTGILEDSGPEVARRLKDEGVDVVLLTPT